MVARLPLAQREETATFIDLAKWAVQLFFINYTSLYIQYTVYRLIYYTIYRLPQKEEKVFQKAWVAQTPSPPKKAEPANQLVPKNTRLALVTLHL